MNDSKKENEIRARAVMGFVNNMIGAFESGFTDTNTATLAEIYRYAQHHVNDEYLTKTKLISEEWGQHTANACRDEEKS